MDGSAFKSGEVDAAVSPETASDAVPDGIAELLPVDVAAATVHDSYRHWLAVMVAGIAHVVLIAAILPARIDAMGEGGVSLEAVAVSIVDTVPVLSAPDTARPDASIQPPDAEADEANSAAAAEAPAAKPEEPIAEAKPYKQALALDLPPDAVPPPPDALALPARQPDAEREPPREAVAPATAPAAPPVLPSVSSAEASSGAVRAYAASVSRVLDRHKPRNRGMRGLVRIQFVIDPTGRAEPPLVLATSGNANLDSLVVTAVQSMSFPAPPPEMSPRQRTFNVPFAFR